MEDRRRRIAEQIEEIPTLPGIVPRLLRILEDEESSANQIAQAISHDPALTVKLLRVANSAYYGLPSQVTSIQKAVVLLGLRMVRSLALSIPVIHGLSTRLHTSHFSMEGLWIHSLAVSTLIQHLGRLHGRKHAEDLFIIGVLHDLGKVVLAEAFQEEFSDSLAQAELKPTQRLHECEAERIGVDHAEVASVLLRHWKFPEVISGPVTHHHRKDAPPGVDPLDLALLRVSNAVVQQVGIGLDGNVSPPEISPEDSRILWLSDARLTEMRDYLASRRTAIAEFYAALW